MGFSHHVRHYQLRSLFPWRRSLATWRRSRPYSFSACSSVAYSVGDSWLGGDAFSSFGYWCTLSPPALQTVNARLQTLHRNNSRVHVRVTGAYVRTDRD